MREASLVLILRDDGKVLSIMRDNNPNDYALIDGKKTDEETFEDAAMRECLEETGLRCYDLKEVFERQDKEFIVKTFLVKEWYGDVKSSSEGQVQWVDLETLMNGKSFGEYNSALFKAMGLV